MLNITLYGERLAVSPIYETTTKGGLTLPPNTSGKHRKSEVLKGRVVAVSHDANLDRNNIPVRLVPSIIGRVVHYFAGQVFEVRIDDIDYHIIDMGTLMCVED